VLSVGQLVLSNTTDVVVIGSLLDTRSVARYSVASQLANIVALAISAVQVIGAPMIADHFANRSRAEFQRLVTAVSRVNASIGLPLLAVLAVGGPLLLRLFGPEYVDAYPILLVLCGATLQGVLCGALAGFVMTMTGHQVAAAWIVGASSVLYLALAWPLTSRLGAVGTALATAVSFWVRAILLEWYLRRRLGVSVLPLGANMTAARNT
jgi:O-antigen/teichoic acid export membrane protein